MLFIFYLLAGCFLLPRIPFVKNSGLRKRDIVILFLLKVFTGMLVGWIPQHYGLSNDYWSLQKEGLLEYDLLCKHPVDFITSIFHSPYKNAYGGFLHSTDSYWNDLRNNSIIKILAIGNFFSQGNFYINTLFFNFVGIMGPVALFRMFTSIYPHKKIPILIGCFLLPSALYFSSGIHKDLIVFCMLGLFCYSLYFSVNEKATTKRKALLIISFLMLLLFKNFLVIALLPAILAYLIISKKNKNPLLIYTCVYGLILLIVIFIEHCFPYIEPLKIISQRQADFLQLGTATSQISLLPLSPTLKSFLHNLPEALNHVFLRPSLWETGGIFYVVFAIEWMLYLLIALIILFTSGISALLKKNQFILMLFVFILTFYLFIGYTIPNLFSIIRYKSLFLPLFITPLLCNLHFKNRT